MRVCLFTDTLADVNGVSRFIRSVAEQAAGAGRELTVLTSTRLALPAPGAARIENFPPRLARPMPGYENLELVLPPALAMLRRARELRPDAIHISTPGPVGLVGLLAARLMGTPRLGVYHTDFPAYIDHLFADPVVTRAASAYMRLFYRRFATVFTRSAEYGAPLAALGISGARVVRLLPGIDTAAFQPSLRDESVWDGLGIPRSARKVLYVGRVSVEKNLPLLASAWKRFVETDPDRGRPGSPVQGARLVVVGDGPYRARMERELAGHRAVFPGFRHGRELSAIYASSDLFAFPSATDTLGQVVMEAQSSGLPVLVSDRGGPREVVQDGRTGLVLPAYDPRAWAAAIGALLGDDERRLAMGRAAHDHIRPMTIRGSFDHFWEVHRRAGA